MGNYPQDFIKRGIFGYSTVIGSEKIILNGTVGTLTYSKYKDATFALIKVHNSNVRVCVDGSTPTATDGIPVKYGSTIELEIYNELTNFKAINDNFTTILYVVYYA